MDKFFSFPRWSEVLDNEDFSESQRRAYRITIQWYLGDLKRQGRRATIKSAGEFLEARVRERKPTEWMVERWREALNWFYGPFPASWRWARRTVGGA